MTPEIIKLSNNEVSLGSTIIITSSGGEDVASTAITWSCGSRTGTTNLGNFTFTENVFEPLAPNSSYVNVVFTMVSTFGDGTTASSTATCKVNIPDKYSPILSVSSVASQPLYNGHIRAGSSATTTVYYSVIKTGSSPITVSVADLTCAAPVSYTIYNDRIVFSLPQIGADYYTLAFRLVATDTRGRSDSNTVSAAKIGTIYCFDAPKVEITSVVRCDHSGLETANGQYARVRGKITDSSTPYSTTIKVLKTQQISVSNGAFDVIVGDGELDLGISYKVEVSYISNAMNASGYRAIIATAEVEAQKVPISLLDNGSVMGASFGEMIQPYNDSSADVIVNFANGSDMRASSNNNVVVASAYDVINTRNYIMDTILGNLKFVAISEDSYNKLKQKDGSTIYFIY